MQHNLTKYSACDACENCCFLSRVADLKVLISDQDSDPALGSLWIRIRILAVEIFVKFTHLKSECTFKWYFCAEIELCVENSVLITAFVFQEA